MARTVVRQLRGLVPQTVLVAALAGFASAARAEAIEITRFPVPTPQAGLSGITAGPDGNLWFTESAAGKIGRITQAGVITEFPLSMPTAGPFTIVAGPDGALWFTEVSANRLGRITTAGQITEFAIPTVGSGPRVIAAGPDGNLWFTQLAANQIGRITPAGVITEFPIPTPFSEPFGIAAGPDGNLWFAETGGNQIGRITPAGVITEFPIPTADVRPQSIIAGPDGALWFTEFIAPIGAIATAGLGRITPAGVITEFPIPTIFNGINRLVTGPDGAIWFTELRNFGRVTLLAAPSPGIAYTTFAHPRTLGSDSAGITVGPDGALWFAEEGGNAIGRLNLTPLLGLSPGSGIYVTTQELDPTVLVAPGLAVTGGRITHNGRDVTGAAGSCFTPGTILAGGHSFRCAGVSGSTLGAGTHVFGAVLDLADGRSLSGGVTWEIFANSEP